MSAKRVSCKVAFPAVVAAITMLPFLCSVRDTAAFQIEKWQPSGETCAFTLQMEKPSFRQRYLRKVARLLEGAASSETASVEGMYGNIRKVSFFGEELDGGAEALSNGLVIDPLSVDCLGCHDGLTASNVTINLKNDPFRHSGRGLGSGSSEHPIGMDYGRYAAHGYNDYKQLFGNTKMILVNGKVGCLTCHDPLNQEKGHLVMSDDGSTLCLTCHSK